MKAKDFDGIVRDFILDHYSEETEFLEEIIRPLARVREALRRQDIWEDEK